MPELTALLKAARDSKHDDRRFFAAIQGIDLDKNAPREQIDSSAKRNSFEDMQARAFSGGRAEDADDILSLWGGHGERQGMKVGESLNDETSYTRIRDGEMKNPMG